MFKAGAFEKSWKTQEIESWKGFVDVLPAAVRSFIIYVIASS